MTCQWHVRADPACTAVQGESLTSLIAKLLYVTFLFGMKVSEMKTGLYLAPSRRENESLTLRQQQSPNLIKKTELIGVHFPL